MEKQWDTIQDWLEFCEARKNGKIIMSEHKMIDGLYCTCGGGYDHVDSTENDDNTISDSYQCGNCETRCMSTWRIGTGEVIKTEYDRSAINVAIVELR